ncbi:MAG: molecular chaperone [Alphaproteobacteria bacterium]|nr:molecular chaperone [Alphaproteobacteria bacterium]
MRDAGLAEAIGAAGGIGALARALGISQPSVSNWQQVPPNRVIAIETATGIPRHVLRPDLYPMNDSSESDVDEIDVARSREYALLAVLLGRAPNAELLVRLRQLRGDATPLGMAHIALAECASQTSAEEAANEFFALFIGLGRGELLPFASYYLTGFLHERPLARVREDMASIGIERVAEMREPEDHIAILCESMSGIIGRRFAVGAVAERRFFDRHLKPWAQRFFADLETARTAKFYRIVGTIGRTFMEIEDEAFALDAPDRRGGD